MAKGPNNTIRIDLPEKLLKLRIKTRIRDIFKLYSSNVPHNIYKNSVFILTPKNFLRRCYLARSGFQSPYRIP